MSNHLPPYRWDSQLGFVPNYTVVGTTSYSAGGQIYPLRFPSTGTCQAYQPAGQTHPLRFPYQTPQPWNQPLNRGLSYLPGCNPQTVTIRQNSTSTMPGPQLPAMPQPKRCPDERHPVIDALLRPWQEGDPVVEIQCSECKHIRLDEDMRFLAEDGKYVDGEKRVCLGPCPLTLGEQVGGFCLRFRRHYAVNLAKGEKVASIDLEVEHDKDNMVIKFK